MLIADLPDSDSLRLAIVGVAIYLGLLWLALVALTYRDIRQRTPRFALRLASALLVLALFLPGYWLYLMLRPKTTIAQRYSRSLEEELLLQELRVTRACPSCRARVEEDYLICPVCCTDLKEECRNCGRALGFAWAACPSCRTTKSPDGVVVTPARAAPAERVPAVPGPGVPPPLRPQKDLHGGFLEAVDVQLVANVIRDIRSRRPTTPAAEPPAEAEPDAGRSA